MDSVIYNTPRWAIPKIERSLRYCKILRKVCWFRSTVEHTAVKYNCHYTWAHYMHMYTGYLDEVNFSANATEYLQYIIFSRSRAPVFRHLQNSLYVSLKEPCSTVVISFMWGTMFEAIVIRHNSFLHQKDINLKSGVATTGKGLDNPKNWEEESVYKKGNGKIMGCILTYKL